MKYLTLSLILVGLLSFVGAIPTFADVGAGVSVTLTTTITGGDSGGSSGGGYSGGGAESLSTLPDDTIENMKKYWLPPIPDEPIAAPQQVSTTIIDPPLLPKETVLAKVPVVEEKPQFSMATMAGIAFWAIIIGLGVWLLWWFLNRRRSKDELS
jgi:hypothetical protein